MRIVLVAAEYNWPNYAGGIQTYTYVLARSLIRSGHEVHIITTDLEGVERHYIEDNIAVHCVGPQRILPRLGARSMASPGQVTSQPSKGAILLEGPSLLRRSWRVRDEVLRLVRNHGIDIVEVPDWNAEGLWLTVRPFVPVVVMLHCPRFASNRANCRPRALGLTVAEHLEKQAILRATAIVSPSLAMARAVAQEYRLPQLEDRITVIPNPVDSELFRPVVVGDKPEQDPTLTVTYVGRLAFQKGVHVLADAIPEIKRAYPDVRFKFIGGDTPLAPGGGSMQAYLRLQLQPYLDTIEFIGPLPQHELPGHYSGSAVVVVPSFYESFGLTCVEAMACGACVVAGRVGGLGEIIHDGETGYFVPPGNAKALAQMVVHLLARPEERRRVGANARTAVMGRMSSECVAEQKVQLFEQVLARHKVKGDLWTALA